MKQNYSDCLTRLLKDEGGYSNNKNDSGGPTNFGITLTDYRKYIKPTATAADVKGMSVNDAKSIYKSKYWDALNCDSLSGGVDYTVFDYGVNSGIGRPSKALVRFSGLKDTALINAINDERVSFLRSIAKGKNAVFLNGWLSRVSRVRAYSLSLAKNNSAGATIGTGVAGFAAAASQFWHAHEGVIIFGGIATAIAVGTAIHLYLNRKKTNG